MSIAPTAAGESCLKSRQRSTSTNNNYIDYGCVSDCNYLLSCVRDDTLRLVDLRTNKIINTFEQYDHVAVGSSEGSVFIWAVSNPEKPLVVLRNEHSAPVTAVSWHQFTNNVASVDRSRRAVVWADV
ncbi:Uncharacterized protein FWK35_00024930 [Aphis craccivora]|uniref:Uncharacterized protein n=1 Tax=Aphis craccivora TaxID=307492 RepID=A0A6G0Z2J6_APHCR|nr:Uncharacterized protein FWK35_00024930 [Aphis craccivora]